MNNITLVGRITRELELKPTSNSKYVKFTIAVDRIGGKNKEQKTTDYIPVIVWGTAAENLIKYSGKGKLISVIGELHVTSYTKDEEKRTAFEVEAEKIRYLEWNASEVPNEEG